MPFIITFCYQNKKFVFFGINIGKAEKLICLSASILQREKRIPSPLDIYKIKKMSILYQKIRYFFYEIIIMMKTVQKAKKNNDLI